MNEIPDQPAYVYRAVFVGNYDGDTITVDIDLGCRIWQRGVRLRLLGIDTPELRGDERDRGLEARDFVRKRLKPGDEIIIRTVRDRTGKYGRLLAAVFYRGKNLNQELINAGLANGYMQ